VSGLRGWHHALIWLISLIALIALLSYFIGHFLLMLVILLSGLLVRQVVLLARLERWLSRGGKGKIPTGLGIWGEIYHHLYNIRKKEKKTKKKLAKIVEQFRKSTDVLPDAAVVLKRFDEIEWSNKLAKELLGIKKSDKGQRISNLIRCPEFAEFLAHKADKPTLNILSPVDSAMILQFRIVSFGLNQHLLIAHDVTQQKNLELMRKNFVANVSHELRTPLTVLKGYLETLQEGELSVSQSPLVTISLREMMSQTDRMQCLVDDLLLLARLETHKAKNDCVDVVKLINTICTESQGISCSSQRIICDLESGCHLYGEEKALRSAFSNLLVNALKYSAEDSQVKVIWQRKKSGLIFEVIDQGEGIDAIHIPRLTERFFRVETTRRKKIAGTGLGLAIVKHVLIGHDAQLEINSQLGQGSCFRCIFPLSRQC